MTWSGIRVILCVLAIATYAHALVLPRGAQNSAFGEPTGQQRFASDANSEHQQRVVVAIGLSVGIGIALAVFGTLGVLYYRKRKLERAHASLAHSLVSAPVNPLSLPSSFTSSQPSSTAARPARWRSLLTLSLPSLRHWFRSPSRSPAALTRQVSPFDLAAGPRPPTLVSVPRSVRLSDISITTVPTTRTAPSRTTTRLSSGGRTASTGRTAGTGRTARSERLLAEAHRRAELEELQRRVAALEKTAASGTGH
ncbi:hypothetical protein MIND_00930900 [Mycena indigotica]|uniref:Transmembrane protein n=1 Tax=Mycena indigotica TaxID=2126181 RepID=A0A8H6VYY6_9AGAR|nr:uncharacterized protein MIND_00930900 [Mycena indigotica]KAF7296986.1 hypothetical protein MIND_00930900 [Mycena indigotica]